MTELNNNTKTTENTVNKPENGISYVIIFFMIAISIVIVILTITGNSTEALGKVLAILIIGLTTVNIINTITVKKP